MAHDFERTILSEDLRSNLASPLRSKSAILLEVSLSERLHTRCPCSLYEAPRRPQRRLTPPPTPKHPQPCNCIGISLAPPAALPTPTVPAIRDGPRAGAQEDHSVQRTHAEADVDRRHPGGRDRLRSTVEPVLSSNRCPARTRGSATPVGGPGPGKVMEAGPGKRRPGRETS